MQIEITKPSCFI